MSIGKRAKAGRGSGSQPAHISQRQQRFTLVEADGEETQIPPEREGYVLDVIIADVNPNKSRIYYADAYDQKETAPPSCQSFDGMHPDPELDGHGPYNADGAPASTGGTCAHCYMAKWGSEINAKTGKKNKACKEHRKLAVIYVGNGKPYRLHVPPASLKLFDAYVDDVCSKVVDGQEVDLPHVITRISFDRDTQGVLNFRSVGWAADAEVEVERFIETGELGPLICSEPATLDDLPPPIALQPAPKRVAAKPEPADEPAQEAPRRRGRPPKQPVNGFDETAAPPPETRGRSRFDLPFED